jgi:poly-gamma-glutamate synthesis protein (capsule biosynthesis protein)
VEPDTGKLVELRMVPMQAQKMRLRRALPTDAQWLRTVLDEVSLDFGSRIELESEGELVIRPPVR